MFIARWQFTARFGKTDECVAILHKWELDVAQRIGWRNVRLVSGYIGAAREDVEVEVHVDNIGDLEGAWNDLERNEHHKEYLKKLEPFVLGGTNRWVVLRGHGAD